MKKGLNKAQKDWLARTIRDDQWLMATSRTLNKIDKTINFQEPRKPNNYVYENEKLEENFNSIKTLYGKLLIEILENSKDKESFELARIYLRCIIHNYKMTESILVDEIEKRKKWWQIF